MSKLFSILILLAMSSCYRVTLDESKKNCEANPNYIWRTPKEVSDLQWEAQGYIGGRYFEEDHCCSVKGVIDYWNDPDPDIQYTINAIKEITGTEDRFEAQRQLFELQEIDLSDYPEITDLRPFKTKRLDIERFTLPENAKIKSLFPLSVEGSMEEDFDSPKVLEAEGLIITGTRAEDCPIKKEIDVDDKIFDWFNYPKSVVEFCRNSKEVDT